MKKTQLAVETLLIYGIVFLIVMLAVGALISFGVLDLGSLLPDQCQVSGGLSCENYLVTQNLVKIEFKNNMNKNINSLDVTIKGEGDTEGLWNCEWATSNELVVQGDTSSPLSIPCNIKVPRGKKLSGKLYINVSFTGSQIERPMTGKIRATVS